VNWLSCVIKLLILESGFFETTCMVPNNSACWQGHEFVVNLPRVLTWQSDGRTAEFAPLNRELDALTVTLALASLLTYSHIYLQFNDHHINDNTQLIMTKKLQSTAK